MFNAMSQLWVLRLWKKPRRGHSGGHYGNRQFLSARFCIAQHRTSHSSELLRANPDRIPWALQILFATTPGVPRFTTWPRRSSLLLDSPKQKDGAQY